QWGGGVHRAPGRGPRGPGGEAGPLRPLGAECDVRHHHHSGNGEPDASADSHLLHVARPGPGGCRAGWLWNVWQQVQSTPPRRFRAGLDGHRLRDPGPGVSAGRAHSDRCRGSGAGRRPRNYALSLCPGGELVATAPSALNPPSAPVPIEDPEQRWPRTVYRPNLPQLTVRTVVMGILLGALMCCEPLRGPQDRVELRGHAYRLRGRLRAVPPRKVARPGPAWAPQPREQRHGVGGVLG